MSRPTNQVPATNGTSAEKSYFEQQRGLLIRDIGESLEQVLQNLNKLNRSLEGVTAVGNEFSAVEALWSHFENVMAKEPETNEEDKASAPKSAQETPVQSSASKR